MISFEHEVLWKIADVSTRDEFPLFFMARWLYDCSCSLSFWHPVILKSFSKVVYVKIMAKNCINQTYQFGTYLMRHFDMSFIVTKSFPNYKLCFHKYAHQLAFSNPEPFKPLIGIFIFKYFYYHLPELNTINCTDSPTMFHYVSLRYH